MSNSVPRDQPSGTKEAAIKCGPEFAALKPAQIEVRHDEGGRPRLAIDGADVACEISISHAGSTAVAVCWAI